MLQEEHSAIHLTFIKLSFVIKIFILAILSSRLRQIFLYISLAGGKLFSGFIKTVMMKIENVIKYMLLFPFG